MQKRIFIGLILCLVFVASYLIFIDNRRDYVGKMNDLIEEIPTRDELGAKTPILALSRFCDLLDMGNIDEAILYISISNRDVAKNFITSLDLNELRDFTNILRGYSEKDISYLNDLAEIKYSTVLSAGQSVKIAGQDFNIPAGEYAGVIKFKKHSEGMWVIYAI